MLSVEQPERPLARSAARISATSITEARMLERQVWRNFVAVTFSVAVVGIGATLPLTALR
ncbi:hypothetical protein GCM10010971_13960 [Silvimonas amylolytica]|uniref:Uncharacterized protein n=1 Tax=Silvimonas amylolytica TaxID=449663 RepID=A0ABQ2PJC9_9NEIS|nr:hypothetical protein GCM10010971_13960 [Silvimonas amylolytica]